MLSAKNVDFFNENGYLVIENFADADELVRLRRRALEISRADDPQRHNSVFKTNDQDKNTDAWFLESGSKVRCFLEDGVDVAGATDVPHNKIGHALHDLDPVFRSYAYSCKMKQLVRSLGCLEQPTIVQSMYIFKGRNTGGPVSPHQDGSFIITEPASCLGVWLAVDEANEKNGCLHAVPGSHRSCNGGKLPRLFLRTAAHANSVGFEPAGTATYKYDLTGSVSLPVAAGSIVLIHCGLVHFSHANTSDADRHAFTLHFVDLKSHYSERNWLQRPVTFPFKPFYSND